jgi:galactokinase
LIRAVAPGRVNLIGDHTDHTGGVALPMAIDLVTTVTGQPGGDRIVLRSDVCDGVADVALAVDDPAAVEPPWARYVAGVVAEVRPQVGFTGVVSSTVPAGAGLSSSAALEVATALALGADADPVTLARMCQRAEQRAAGVPCGVMDQLASVCGVEGHALLLDGHDLHIEPVQLPDHLDVVAVHSGEPRRLAGSAYAERHKACVAAEAVVGPLRLLRDISDLGAIGDPVTRRRARHVVTENARVLACADALRHGEVHAAGALMLESHASLRDDFEVSTPALDHLVNQLRSTPGVYGARLTGAGFGGCVVALCRPGALDIGWRLAPSAGAFLAGTS